MCMWERESERKHLPSGAWLCHSPFSFIYPSCHDFRHTHTCLVCFSSSQSRIWTVVNHVGSSSLSVILNPCALGLAQSPFPYKGAASSTFSPSSYPILLPYLFLLIVTERKGFLTTMTLARTGEMCFHFVQILIRFIHRDSVRKER